MDVDRQRVRAIAADIASRLLGSSRHLSDEEFADLVYRLVRTHRAWERRASNATAHGPSITTDEHRAIVLEAVRTTRGSA